MFFININQKSMGDYLVAAVVKNPSANAGDMSVSWEDPLQ